MNWWIAGLGVGAVVLIAGLVFMAKKWATEGEASIGYKAIKVVGSPAFLVFVVGAAFVGYSINKLADEQRETRDPSLILGQIREVRGAVPAPDVDPRASEEERQYAYGKWLIGFFDRAQVVIDKGADDGLRRGQLVTTLDDRVTPRTVRRSELGEYNSAGTAILRVVSVFPGESIAQLKEFAIEAYVGRIANRPRTSRCQGRPPRASASSPCRRLKPTR
jgi:hypothetical protein